MAEKNVPAVQAINDVRTFINSEKMRKQFSNALPKVLDTNRFVRCLITSINRNPDLANADRMSVISAAMSAAQLGLEIDAVLGRAYLLPYRDKKKRLVAQLIVGYRGYVDLAYRSGQLAGLQAEVVFERDHFVYSYGLNPELEHIPADEEDRGPLKYAYCVAHLKNGGSVFRVLNRSEIARHRTSSRAAASEYSPWTTHEAEMWRKTAIRALASLLPLSPELRDAVAADENDDPPGSIPLDLGEAIVSAETSTDTTEKPSATEEKPATASGLAAAAKGGAA